MAKEGFIEKDYAKKITLLFKHPSSFFKSVEKENDYRKIIYFYVVVTIVSIIAGLITSLVQIIFKPETLTATLGLTILSLISSVIFGILFAFITPFIGAAITHLGVLVFRGKQGFFNTFKPMTYSSSISQIYKIAISIIGIPLLFVMPAIDWNSITQDQFLQIITSNSSIIFGLIITFGISLISMIHTLTAGVIGLSQYQKMSKWKAFFSMIFLPLIFLIIAGIILILVLIYMPATTVTA